MSFTLRVSVLEHCQLRCNYCLPQGPTMGLKKSGWLTPEHYKMIAKAMVPLEIEKIRFTGGEPLLREDLPSIVKVFGGVFSNAKMAVTTNGQRFNAMAQDLCDAGLKSVTFHLDTLKEDRYERVMGKGTPLTVLSAIEHARKIGLNVKINMVVQKGVNDDEIFDFLHVSKSISVEVRFIELMNTGSARAYVNKVFMSGQEILDEIRKKSSLKSLGRKIASAPAERFFASDLGVRFGLIASDTRPFCANCNRLRLSADGKLRTCLYEPLGHDIGIRSVEISEEEIVKNIAAVVAKKTSYHPALNKDRKSFSMSQIGG